eukprot:TRINITY_DN455_c0_g1_i1.p1 TRINITY_DN455_c0_g1~~TRINITY_DN455_c0_g1_i1.p1  ORF type:complete len:276 (+),score=77.28 TRINITY_DN455_c0_g1_i1:12-839(+)
MDHIDYDPDAAPAVDTMDLGSDGDYGFLDDDDGSGDYGFESGGDFDADDYGDFDMGSDYGSGGLSGSDDGDAELENMFLEAKDVASDTEDKASVIHHFEEVLEQEGKGEERGEWGFRSCKYLVRIHYGLGNHTEVKSFFNRLLTDYAHLLVEKEKALKKLLESLEESPDAAAFFQSSLQALVDGGNKKAALRLELIQARMLAKQEHWDTLGPVLERLHANCRTESGEDDPSKGSQLLEIYALKIQVLFCWFGVAARFPFPVVDSPPPSIFIHPVT